MRCRSAPRQERICASQHAASGVHKQFENARFQRAFSFALPDPADAHSGLHRQEIGAHARVD